MSDRPTIENAPGLTWRPCPQGWEARWRPRADLVKRGYPPHVYRLWQGIEPTGPERAYVSDQCGRLQDEMLIWGRGGVPVVGLYDGTLKALIACYQTDPDSEYRTKRYRTRQNYDNLTRRLERDHGADRISEIRPRLLKRWHEEWTVSGVAMAHALMGMLRTVVGFGANMLEDDECAKLRGHLHSMRFKMSRPRQERMTAEQAVAIRAKAHDMALPSMALAQALQFDLMLRQKDVIGEFVPLAEPGISDVIDGDQKWLRGLRWEEIDHGLILRHTTSKRNKEIEVNLRLAPMVMEEIPVLDGLPRGIATGPIIIYEITGLPYRSAQFRREWRKVARAAGVPDHVFNMDSRAGGISEATDAGASLEMVRHAATHSNVSTTANYSRGSAEKVREVMELRAAHRKKAVGDGK